MRISRVGIDLVVPRQRHTVAIQSGDSLISKPQIAKRFIGDHKDRRMS